MSTLDMFDKSPKTYYVVVLLFDRSPCSVRSLGGSCGEESTAAVVAEGLSLEGVLVAPAPAQDIVMETVRKKLNRVVVMVQETGRVVLYGDTSEEKWDVRASS